MGSSSSSLLPMAESHRTVVKTGALSLLEGGNFKDDAEEPSARKLIRQETLEEENMEEKVMKKRFEEWMVKYGRSYKEEEEKAMRYELFKSTARMVDESNAKAEGLCTFGTNDFADMTHEELSCYCRAVDEY